MIWSSDDEMKGTLKRVKEFAAVLKARAGSSVDTTKEVSPTVMDETTLALVPAPGSAKDQERHSNHRVDLSSKSSLLNLPQMGVPVLPKETPAAVIGTSERSEEPTSRKRVKLDEKRPYQSYKPDPPEENRSSILIHSHQANACVS